MGLTLFNISEGVDILAALSNFSRSRGLAVSILSSTGSVSALSLGNLATREQKVDLIGQYYMLSLTGTVTPSGSMPAVPFSVSVVGAQGQLCGVVVGPLIAGESVTLTAITFENLEVYDLMWDGAIGGEIEEEEDEVVNGAIGGEMEEDEVVAPKMASPPPPKRMPM